jgi:hypothetical protein
LKPREKLEEIRANSSENSGFGEMAHRYAIPKEVLIKRPMTMKEMEELFEDLEKMNLELLLALPWNVMGDTYLRDFVPNAPMLQKFPEVR